MSRGKITLQEFDRILACADYDDELRSELREMGFEVEDAPPRSPVEETAFSKIVDATVDARTREFVENLTKTNPLLSRLKRD